jgi:Fe-Mn family superoxide dismutase
MSFTLPELPYPFEALEPHIDSQTMRIHHGKHHQAYITKANAALEGTAWADQPIEKVLAALADLPDSIRTGVRNNAGGHFNHSLFWQVMAPEGQGGGGAPTGDLADAINAAFGSFDGFKERFATAAATRFGSGWAWLTVAGGSLKVCSTANQDNPITDDACPGTPILGLDVWEHAYYLKYQNRRPDYVMAWWSVVNWSEVARRYADAMV